MATFHMPAGIFKQDFSGPTPEAALEKAKLHHEGDYLSADEVEPTTEAYCVTRIVISDEAGNELATWQRDQFSLQRSAPAVLAALEQQVEFIQDLVKASDTVESVTDSIHDFVDSLVERFTSDAHAAMDGGKWENRDLSGAIADLEQSLPTLKKLIAAAKGSDA
ncbi:MAG: hypothetical protein ACRD19_11515 [Terriglobia bacterium]